MEKEEISLKKTMYNVKIIFIDFLAFLWKICFLINIILLLLSFIILSKTYNIISTLYKKNNTQQEQKYVFTTNKRWKKD